MSAEFGWLVEKDIDGVVMYLTVVSGFFTWTPENLLALRLARRADAELISIIIGEDVDRIAEHQWG